MAQRSILSMFKKSNDRLGNPVKDKIRLGQPESVKIRSESRTGNPTLADNNRLGQPENYAENQSDSSDIINNTLETHSEKKIISGNQRSTITWCISYFFFFFFSVAQTTILVPESCLVYGSGNYTLRHIGLSPLSTCQSSMMSSTYGHVLVLYLLLHA